MTGLKDEHVKLARAIRILPMELVCRLLEKASSLFTGVARLRWDKPGRAGEPHRKTSAIGENGVNEHGKVGLMDGE